MAKKIAIIEDDRQIRKVVEGYLQQEGFRVLAADDGDAGLALVLQEKPSLLVLDLMLPGLDGWEIIRRLRASHDPALSGIYIILLTARVEETDRIVGLELGADDYVTKPFSPRELIARIRAALRRLDAHMDTGEVQVLQMGDLRLDPAYRTVTLKQQPVDLTSVEFDLLHHFMQHPGRPFTRSDLLDITQSDAVGDTSAYERTIDVHVKNLRQKLGDSARDSRFIETVQRVGYRFLQQPSSKKDSRPP